MRQSTAQIARPGIGPWRIVNAAVIVLVYTLMLLPLIFVVWLSFFDSAFPSFPPPGYTLKWFAKAAQETSFVSGFVTSVQVATISAAVGVTAGTLASLALVRGTFRGRGVLNMLLLSPLIVPGIVIGTALFIFYVDIAEIFRWDPMRQLTGLVFAHTMLTIPWSIRLISANLVMIDPAVEEASRNLGASRWTTFRRVTLPIMRSGIVAATLFSFIVSFENLEVSLMLVAPGYTTFPIALLQYLEFNIDPTIAAASTVQIVVIGLGLLITDRYVKLSRIV